MSDASSTGGPPRDRRPLLDPQSAEEFRRAAAELFANAAPPVSEQKGVAPAPALMPEAAAEPVFPADAAAASPIAKSVEAVAWDGDFTMPPFVEAQPHADLPAKEMNVGSLPLTLPSPAELPVRLTGPGLTTDEFSEEPWEPSERPRWIERWRRGWRLILVISVLAGTYVGWRGGRDYQSFKHWRARSMAEEALLLAKDHNDAGARELLDRAAVLAPREPAVMRAIVAFCEPRRDPMAMYALRQLVLLGEATAADWEQLCRLSFEMGRPELAPGHVLRAWAMAPAGSLTPGQLLLACQWLAGRGRVADAEQKLREKIEENLPESIRLKIALANLLLAGSQRDEAGTKRITEGMDTLKSISSDPAVSVIDRGDAARMLSSFLLQPACRDLLKGGVAPVLVRDFQNLAAAEPGTALRNELAAASMTLAAELAPPQSVLDPLLKKAPSLSLPDRLMLGRWLNDQGFAGELQGLVSRTPESETDEEWMKLRLESLLALKKGDEIRALLALHSQPLPPLAREVFLYRLVRAEGGNARALQQRCREILSTAGNGAGTPVVMDAAAIMERFQELETAVQLYHRAENDERHGLVARLAIVRCLNATPDASSGSLIQALEGVLRLWPHLDDARNDLLYLKLIDGTADAAEIKAAPALAEAYPWILAYRITAALAEFRGGNPARALAILERERLPWDKVQPGWLSVYGTLLAANQRMDQARAVGVRLLGMRLTPGEAKLFRQYVPDAP